MNLDIKKGRSNYNYINPCQKVKSIANFGVLLGMGRSLSSFVCQQCGYETGKWLGKCPECGEWNSLVETISTRSEKSKVRGQKLSTNVNPTPLSSITSKSTARILTKISELDRVLGGGLVPGQVVLIAGEPGIGKSTLLLQVAEKLVETRPSQSELVKTSLKQTKLISTNGEAGQFQPISTILYVSGEESASQIKIRADRMGIKNTSITLLETTDVDEIQLIANSQQLKAIIVDSIQTIATSDLTGMTGSVGQVRECAFRLVRLAKETNVPVFIVGHVTKEGGIAGPSVLMHIVDSVLWFEGDKVSTLRMLRAVKNRFGPTDETGIVEMGDGGLVEVSDPERAFLTSGKGGVTGSVVALVLQGTRPILVEVQSLVVGTKIAFPKRVAQGVDLKKVELLLAVLIRRCGLPLYEYDVFVNIAGGVNLRGDPSCDLALSLSLASSFLDKSLMPGSLAVGEVGLLGDIRSVVSQDKRLKEAKRLGFKNLISGVSVKSLQEAIKKHLRSV